MKFIRLSILAWLLCTALATYAQGPNNTGTYYAAANLQKGRALKTAFATIISHGTQDLDYSKLWEAYEKTDLRPDGTIWDMYSTITHYNPKTDRAGNYRKEGDCYNREHSVPQSWFNKQSPMRSDLFHVYPTDGYVNNRRGNMPFGENQGESYQSEGGLSKVGRCTVTGFNGPVFEPADEYKGDFARTYFYMATRYEDYLNNWTGNIFGPESYPGIVQWQLQMLLRWAKNDPVSEKETKRNEAIYQLQHNRNPFIDYPGLEQYVWGDSVNVVFHYDGKTNTPITPVPHPGGETPPSPGPITPPTPPVNPTTGQATFKLVTSLTELKAGDEILIGYTSGGTFMWSSAKDYRNSKTVAIPPQQTISLKVNEENAPRSFILGQQGTAFTFYDPVEQQYLSYKGSKNNLFNSASATSTEAQWSIDITENALADIAPLDHPERGIFCNTQHHRFACYKFSRSVQRISLFVKVVPSDIKSHHYNGQTIVDVYTISGNLVRRHVKMDDALQNLPTGIYIIGGQKYAVK